MYILKQYQYSLFCLKALMWFHVYCFTPYHLHTMTLWTQQPTQLQRYAVPSHVHPTRFECTKQEKGRPETRQATKKTRVSR